MHTKRNILLSLILLILVAGGLYFSLRNSLSESQHKHHVVVWTPEAKEFFKNNSRPDTGGPSMGAHDSVVVRESEKH